jgi:hypothetical protein
MPLGAYFVNTFGNLDLGIRFSNVIVSNFIINFGFR